MKEMDVMRTRTMVCVLLAAGLSLAGCATNRQPVTAGISPNIVEPMRAGSWLPAARIVSDERPVELLGEFSAEGRAAFEQARSARVAARSSVGPDLTGRDIGECLIRGVVVLCPLALAIRGVVLGSISGVKYIKASVQEPSLLIPDRHAHSLATMLKERASSTALVARASRFGMTHDGTHTEGRLVVRMKAVEASQVRPAWLRIRVTAEAQAFPFPGVALTPTEHVYEWMYGPLSEWAEGSDELVRQALNGALDALAESIGSTYTRSGNSEELGAEMAAAFAAAADSGVAPTDLPHKSEVTPVTVDPSSSPAPAATRSPVPAAGDAWTYQLIEAKPRNHKMRTYRVKIASVTPDTVVEQLADEPGAPMRTSSLQGGYLIREGAVSVFSPYFNPYDAPASGAAIANIKNLDPDLCGSRWICSTTASVRGKELVRVPAGEFEAIKVEVQQTWTARSSQNAGGGARTLTIWYSPQTRRAVKFSSRAQGGYAVQSDFDLVLESYFLN
jgi:hypothetical protein